MDFIYKTNGVCSKQVTFKLEGNIVTGVNFLGGCDGNLKAIAKLVEGMTAEEIEKKLRGNTCGYKNTSCADQLAIAVRKAMSEAEKKAAV